MTIALIVVNVLVFLYETCPGRPRRRLSPGLGACPAEIASGRDLGPAAPLGNVYLTLFTSMFLHGGFLHIASNMIYLWVFGDNVEDAFGHVGYVFFYLCAGWSPGWPRSLLTRFAPLPSVGASGAIAGCSGPILCSLAAPACARSSSSGRSCCSPRIPAMCLIGFWSVTQLISGSRRAHRPHPADRRCGVLGAYRRFRGWAAPGAVVSAARCRQLRLSRLLTDGCPSGRAAPPGR